MFKLFKRKNKGARVYPLWEKMGSALNNRLRRWADWLNRRTVGAGRRTVIFLLTVFCLGWGGSSVYIAVRAVQKRETVVSVKPISVPNTTQPGATPVLDSATMQALKRIHAFKRFIDSLHVYDSSKYQQLVRMRPGLVDSIGYIEQYYGKSF